MTRIGTLLSFLKVLVLMVIIPFWHGRNDQLIFVTPIEAFYNRDSLYSNPSDNKMSAFYGRFGKDLLGE